MIILVQERVVPASWERAFTRNKAPVLKIESVREEEPLGQRSAFKAAEPGSWRAPRTRIRRSSW